MPPMRSRVISPAVSSGVGGNSDVSDSQLNNLTDATKKNCKTHPQLTLNLVLYIDIKPVF